MSALIHKPKPLMKRKRARYLTKPSRSAEMGASLTNLTQQIAAQIAKVQSKRSPRKIHLSIVIDGDKVTFCPARKSPDAKTKQAPAAALESQFDPLEAGRQAVLQMQKAEGGSWTGAELEARFGLTAANLHKRRVEHRIVSWRDAKNQFHYPKWQFNAVGALLPGVQDVLQSFHSLDEWRVMRYFLAPRHQLGDRTALESLRRGDTDSVIAHARAHGEENTW